MGLIFETYQIPDLGKSCNTRESRTDLHVNRGCKLHW